MEITGGSILDCTSSGNGGAVYCNSPALTNEATIYMHNGAVINGHDSLSDSVWNAKRAKDSKEAENNCGGGGIFFRRGTLKIDGFDKKVYIRNCTTDTNGGAIYVLPDGSFTDPEENERYTVLLKDAEIDGHYGSFNPSKENAKLCGGGIYMKMGILSTENCTLKNLRSPFGAAICGRTNDAGTGAATITVKGGIISGNTATSESGAM